MDSLVAVPACAALPGTSLVRSVGAWRFGGFVYDEARALLRRPDGSAVVPRPKTELVLMLLLRRAGCTVSRAELLDAVWPEADVVDDSLTQCIAELRRALGDGASMLQTATRQGYRLAAAVSWQPPG